MQTESAKVSKRSEKDLLPGVRLPLGNNQKSISFGICQCDWAIFLRHGMGSRIDYRNHEFSSIHFDLITQEMLYTSLIHRVFMQVLDSTNIN